MGWLFQQDVVESSKTEIEAYFNNVSAVCRPDGLSSVFPFFMKSTEN